MNTNVDEKSLDWALKTFRPLLKALKLQEVKSEPFLVYASRFRIFNRYNMANCVIVAITKEFTNKDDRGLFIWQYNEKNNFYALYIILNKSLYENNDIDTRFQRKATGIHEFTHCVAAMMTFSRLQSKALVKIMQERMAEQIHTLDKKALELMLLRLTKSSDENQNRDEPFPDSHFRTGGEDFTGEYDRLVKNFLLSYELFCEDEFFNTEKKKEFQKCFKEKGEAVAIQDYILPVIISLSEKKALSIPFIVQRISEEFYKKIKK